jgi:ketosteroid isomerase-like protein
MTTVTAINNKQIIHDAYEAMKRGDIKGFIGVLDPEIEVREPDALPYGGTYKGIDALMGMFAKAGPLLDSSQLIVDELTGDGDKVVAVLRIPLRGGAGEALISEHWTLHEGKATRLQVFWFDTSIVAA